MYWCMIHTPIFFGIAMNIIFDSCKECLVRASCSKICQKVKDEIEKTYDIGIEVDVSLDVLHELIDKSIELENNNFEINEYIEEKKITGKIPYIQCTVSIPQIDGE